MAAVIHIGNIEFNKKGEGSEIASGAIAGHLAGLLQVSVTEIEQALTSRVIAARGSVVHKELDVKQAQLAADALAKALYNRCFSFIVEVINGAIEVEQGGGKVGLFGGCGGRRLA